MPAYPLGTNIQWLLNGRGGTLTIPRPCTLIVPRGRFRVHPRYGRPPVILAIFLFSRICGEVPGGARARERSYGPGAPMGDNVLKRLLKPGSVRCSLIRAVGGPSRYVTVGSWFQTLQPLIVSVGAGKVARENVLLKKRFRHDKPCAHWRLPSQGAPQGITRAHAAALTVLRDPHASAHRYVRIL